MFCRSFVSSDLNKYDNSPERGLEGSSRKIYKTYLFLRQDDIVFESEAIIGGIRNTSYYV